uniref:Uncharacterized protein n=1 Tax=Arundo donax TaxID=35708 RepID=A0A0A9AVH4_ARUDO
MNIGAQRTLRASKNASPPSCLVHSLRYLPAFGTLSTTA